MLAAQKLIQSTQILSKALGSMQFSAPVTHVYNPLDYAWEAHRQYIERWGTQTKRVLFMGMNPGPWGMAQVGVPFGEVALTRDWIGIQSGVERPANEHPKRPIEGFDCTRSEVSGRRLWGYFKERFQTPAAFFKEHFVINYCPLVFMEESGRNRTPDKLPAEEQKALFAACDAHLQDVVAILKPEWIVGVGAFAANRCASVLAGELAAGHCRLGQVLHPSPASPLANRDWAGTMHAQMVTQGIWDN